MSPIKPIETIYNGYRFRSRLEARWAVFFDKLGLQYEYEKEGYDLGKAGWYLPDFWLPDLDCWFEVKGQIPPKEEMRKVRLLSFKSGKRAFVYVGDPWHDSQAFEYVPRLHPAISPYHMGYLSQCKVSQGYPQKSSDPNFGDIDLYFYDEPPIMVGFYENNGVVVYPSMWVECTLCGKVQIYSILSINGVCACWKKDDERYDHLNEDSPRLIAAYTAARQARFEHGG